MTGIFSLPIHLEVTEDSDIMTEDEDITTENNLPIGFLEIHRLESTL